MNLLYVCSRKYYASIKIIIMTVQHHGDAYIQKKTEYKIMHEL
jgi:hypothetical protein